MFVFWQFYGGLFLQYLSALIVWQMLLIVFPECHQVEMLKRSYKGLVKCHNYPFRQEVAYSCDRPYFVFTLPAKLFICWE